MRRKQSLLKSVKSYALSKMRSQYEGIHFVSKYDRSLEFITYLCESYGKELDQQEDQTPDYSWELSIS